MPYIDAEMRDDRLMNRAPFIIIGLMFLVILLSVFVFSKQSLRLDEAQSLWQTSHSVENMIEIVGEDVHVPLYHLMLHYWQVVFGNSARASRMLSLAFYVAIIPAIYLLGKKVYDRRVGVFAAILIGLSPFLNWYGNEIRMYSLFTLLTIVNTYFFVSVYQSKDYAKGHVWFGYAMSGVLGIYTHYFFIFNFVAQTVFLILYRKSFPKESWFGFVWIWVGLVVMYAPWLRYVIHLGAASNTQPHLTPPSSVDVFNTFSEFMFGFQDNKINSFLLSLWPLSVLLLFLGLRRRAEIKPLTIFFFLNLVLPIVIAFVVSSTFKPIYLSRYLILTLPALYLIVGSLIAIYPPRLAFFVKSSLVLVMMITLFVEIGSSKTPVKEDYRAASDYLERYASPSDIIAVSAPFTIYPFLYYYSGSSQVETLPMWNRLQTGSIPAFSESTLPTEVDQLKSNHEVIWVLLSYDQGYEEQVRLFFDTHYERLVAVNFSPNINLYAYRVDYNHTEDRNFAFPVPRSAVVTRQ